MSLAITYWPRLTNPQGKRVRSTWPALLARLSVPRVVADKHCLPGFTFATFRDDRRSLAAVERAYAIGLDFDKGVPPWADLCARFASALCFLHTTYSSTPDTPRARVFLPLSRPVTADEYRRIFGHVAGVCAEGGLVVDRAASDPSRLWFLPAIPPGGEFLTFEGNGAPLDVASILAAIPAPVRPPPPPPRPVVAGQASALDRARAYLAHCPVAISGSGGSTTTFVIAQKLVRGFLLSTEEAFSLLANDWNPRCEPPWSDRELRRKVEQAARAGRMAEGDMLARERGR